eukprot:CAMPEP_0172040948 /NCGR_PEP_ID=MMETSP1041-20130122/24779_1 /TAXON_ID=464988 /ORGANISM="Hemiselmis andersenii, Strain CCMP439" /LENGTH=52 /DNA_ID=CAMNT_0012698897 /DNA_START=218 /DNA_END=373 /DNA_ORIENTATION=+
MATRVGLTNSALDFASSPCVSDGDGRVCGLLLPHAQTSSVGTKQLLWALARF